MAFLIDYLVGFVLSPSKRAFVANEKLSAVIVLASAVALVPTIAWLGSLKLLRLLPALRAGAVVLRLISVGGVASREARRTAKKNALQTGLLTTFLVWVTAASAFTIVEDVGVNGRYQFFLTPFGGLLRLSPRSVTEILCRSHRSVDWSEFSVWPSGSRCLV